MKKSGILLAIAFGLGAFVPGGCQRSDAAADASVHHTVLDAKDAPLRDDFNRGRGFVRLMFLVDPRCPGCLRGLADMGDDLLSSLPKNARLKVYVVHEPVIGGTEKDIPAAAALLKTGVARHYWNPTGDFGREMSHALGYWNGERWVYAWDTWLIFAPDAEWKDAPPRPVWIMHQLAGLEGNPKFMHLDGKVFAAKVNTMLAQLGKKSASR